MKRIEVGLKRFKWVVVILIGLILTKGFYSSYNDLTAGNFTPTPQVTTKDVLAESKKFKLIIIFYKKDQQQSKELYKSSKQFKKPIAGVEIPKQVYVDIDSESGKNIAQTFNVSKAPVLIPVWQETSNISIDGLTTNEMNAHILKNHTIDETSLEQMFTGKWITGGRG